MNHTRGANIRGLGYEFGAQYERCSRTCGKRVKYFGISYLYYNINLYSSPDTIREVKSRRMRWAGHVARMGEERKVYKVLVRKPEGKKGPLG
jgi:hypothetical protein